MCQRALEFGQFAGGAVNLQAREVNDLQEFAEHGADTLRVYQMFMGPLSDSKPWNPRDIVGPLADIDIAAIKYYGIAEGTVAGIPALVARTGYAASKHALHGFFDSLRAELHGAGVAITIACPSFIATGIERHALAGDGQVARRQHERVRFVHRHVRGGARQFLHFHVVTGLFLHLAGDGLLDPLAAALGFGPGDVWTWFHSV